MLPLLLNGDPGLLALWSSVRLEIYATQVRNLLVVDGADLAVPRHGHTGPLLALRKQNHSVYEIAAALKARALPLSPTAVREVLRAEGFAPLPGSQMIPAPHALRAALALKLWSIERKSHIMALVADPGLALFCGLNAMPKKSYLSEYSSRLDHTRTTSLLAAWHRAVAHDALFPGTSFNLDFHSVPYYGEDPQAERHYVSMRSRAQPSVLAFLAQDATGRAFCYANAEGGFRHGSVGHRQRPLPPARATYARLRRGPGPPHLP